MAAAKKDLAKETFETFTAASNDAVKDGIEKSMAAVNDLSAFREAPPVSEDPIEATAEHDQQVGLTEGQGSRAVGERLGDTATVLEAGSRCRDARVLRKS